MNDFNFNQIALPEGTSFTDAFSLEPGAELVSLALTIANITGGTLTITPQTSNNASTWFDLTDLAVISANGDVEEDWQVFKAYTRLKLVFAGGGSDTLDIDLTMVQKQTENDGSTSQQVIGPEGSGDPAATNPVGMGAKAQDPTSLPTPVDVNDRVNLMADLFGRIVTYMGTRLDPVNDIVGTTPRDVSNAGSAALEASRIVKASAGKLFSMEVYNDKATGQFFQLHDSATLPADTAVPVGTPVWIPAKSNMFIEWKEGFTFANGIVGTNSSTLATKTIGAADLWISAKYE